jgi:epsilon-lactone hydrolase
MPSMSGGDGIVLSSWLRWVPRTSSSARLALVSWMLRRLARLELSGAADVPALQEKLLRLDGWLFHPPSWSRCESARMDGVPVEWIQADGATGDRVVLYLHGGGFAFHLPLGYRTFAAHLSRALDARVLLPDYRLAPTHRFPAPQDDCLSAYCGLLAAGVPASRIVLAGDSAGGTLALGLLQRLQRDGLPQPACAVALSPATDLALAGGSMQTLADVDPLLSASALPLLRDMAFGPECRSDPVASPMLGSLAEVAPTLVMCGTREVLLDDGWRYAERVSAAGGRIACEVWEDMPHVFPLLSHLKESHRAMAHIVRFVHSLPTHSAGTSRS